MDGGRMKRLSAVLLAVISSFFGSPSSAQTPSNGAAVCVAGNSQDSFRAAPDGSGGTVVVWSDARSGSYDIYAQRLGPNGTSLWQRNGLVVASAANEQLNPTIIADGSGGWIVAWQDRRNGSYDIYAQRLDSSGASQW